MKFEEYNANPKRKKTGDCAVRAICVACKIPYEQAAKELFDEWMRTGYEMTDYKVVKAVMLRHGFVAHGKPFKCDGTTYKVHELVDAIGRGHRLLIQVANHYTTSESDRLLDSWDCSFKSVYRYFSKEER